MTAVAAMVAGGAMQNLVATIAQGSSVQCGYVSGGSNGTLSPTRVRGVLIGQIDSVATPSGGARDFYIVCDEATALGQSLFSYVLVTDGSGAKRKFKSSDATYLEIGGTLPSWKWGDGTNVVWAVGDDGETKVIEFFL